MGVVGYGGGSMESNSYKINYLTPLEVANLLKVKVYTVYEWRKRGYIIGYRFSRLVRFREDEVLRFAESQRDIDFANGRRRKNGAY